MSNKEQLGYDKPLFILAFDQRSSFTKKLFGLEGVLTPEQNAEISSYKDIIYQGFKHGLELGVPKEEAAVLVDEQLGDGVLRDAGQRGYTFLLSTEASGRDELDLEYGEKFDEHIEKYRPTFVKVLVRYNPEGDEALNGRQKEKMKQLSDYAHAHGYKFLIEPLIPPTIQQLKSVQGDERRYDLELRPALAVEMIRQIQAGGAEPDVWKIEGLEKEGEYQKVVAQARSEGRDNVCVVVLGRHASDEQVEKWLKAAAKVEGMIGFAIGRTIFWEPLLAVKSGKMSGDEAAAAMGEKYLHFYRFFTQAQKS